MVRPRARAHIEARRARCSAVHDARCVCVVGGRLLSGDPDPTGEKVAILRHALAQKPHIEGFFFECAARAPAART